jgi:hypothetical protein
VLPACGSVSGTPGFNVPLQAPLGTYDLDVVVMYSWVEIDRDGFQVEVID